MNTFTNLNELFEYVPNCLICGKPFDVRIDGTLSPVDLKKPTWSRGRERVAFKTVRENGVLIAKSNNYQINIDLATNQILEGIDVFNRMLINQISVDKKCPTCHVKIIAQYNNGSTKKETHFPALTLRCEELHYTLRGGRRVKIEKYYYSDTATASIKLDGKYLPPVPFEFNKIKGIEHLNKRLATIILFH